MANSDATRLHLSIVSGSQRNNLSQSHQGSVQQTTLTAGTTTTTTTTTTSHTTTTTATAASNQSTPTSPRIHSVNSREATARLIQELQLRFAAGSGFSSSSTAPAIAEPEKSPLSPRASLPLSSSSASAVTSQNAKQTESYGVSLLNTMLRGLEMTPAQLEATRAEMLEISAKTPAEKAVLEAAANLTGAIGAYLQGVEGREPPGPRSQPPLGPRSHPPLSPRKSEVRSPRGARESIASLSQVRKHWLEQDAVELPKASKLSLLEKYKDHVFSNTALLSHYVAARPLLVGRIGDVATQLMARLIAATVGDNKHTKANLNGVVRVLEMDEHRSVLPQLVRLYTAIDTKQQWEDFQVMCNMVAEFAGVALSGRNY